MIQHQYGFDTHNGVEAMLFSLRQSTEPRDRRVSEISTTVGCGQLLLYCGRGEGEEPPIRPLRYRRLLLVSLGTSSLRVRLRLRVPFRNPQFASPSLQKTLLLDAATKNESPASDSDHRYASRRMNRIESNRIESNQSSCHPPSIGFGASHCFYRSDSGQ